jgi:uncharacterized protein YaeQ
MALTATPYHLQIALSDVDRGCYESIDIRPARHPSESFRYLMLRVLAYCLSYEPGIMFSKGGLSASDDPPVHITDMTGLLQAWIDVGAPSADRLHRAAKAAPRVALFTAQDWSLLRKEAASRKIHRVNEIAVYRISPSFLDQLEPVITRNTKFTLTRNEGTLYLEMDNQTYETKVEEAGLTPDA